MNTKTVHGRTIVIQHMFDVCEIMPGQIWAPADESDREVFIVSVDHTNKEITYRASVRTYNKSCFDFQCRYCLVVNFVPVAA